MASTAFCKLVQSANVDTKWAKRPRRPVQLQLRPGAIKLHQFVYASHQRLPTELPFGASREPLGWTDTRAKAEQANLVATGGSVAEAWPVLDEAWKAFSDMMELELEQRLDTPIRKKGRKGFQLVPQWAPRPHPG